MDTRPQNPNTLSVDSDVVMESQGSRDIQPDPSPPGMPDPHVEAKEKNLPLITEDANGVAKPYNETETPKEAPSSEPQSPLKKRPTSTRGSAEIFRSLTIDDDDSKSKQSSLSAGDSSSIHTLDSIDDRRLSGRMKKAWRGVTGQSRLDPLEQWMVKHSGGTFTEKPRRQIFGEPSDK